MTAITLAQADRLIDAVLARGAELDCRPLAVIVVEPGCKVKAFKKEDGSSMIRFEMAYGKAYAALAMGRSSKLVKQRAEEKPMFMRYLITASDEQIFPEGGGLQIRNATGEVVGAVGVTVIRGRGITSADVPAAPRVAVINEEMAGRFWPGKDPIGQSFSTDSVVYQIVGEDEADIRAGRVSITSPIARALVGKSEGDVVDVTAPGGIRSYEIVAVRFE